MNLGEKGIHDGRVSGDESRGSRSQAALILFSLAIFLLAVLPRLLSRGMFFDGVTYASIARNLAQGHGSVWHPYYTDFVYPQFYEQPPLGILLQSLAFRLFGDSLHVEAFWGLGVGLLILFLMSRIWKHPELSPPRPSGSWIPLLMFAFIPMTSWVLGNNMLEGTMAVFSTCAAWLAVSSLRAASRPRNMATAFLSGSLVLCAVLIKGPVGFFPLCVPAAWLAVACGVRLWPRAAMATAMMILGLVVPFVLLALMEGDFLYSLGRYFEQQVVSSVSGFREKGTHSFWIMFVVLREILVPFILGALVWVAARFKWRKKDCPAPTPSFWFYLLVAICASLPIVLSPKQLGWYIFPSLPFYSLALASLFAAPLLRLQDALVRTRRRTFMMWTVAILVLLSAIVWMFAAQGQIKRQREFYGDLIIQPLTLAKRQAIAVHPPELKQDWALVASMQRHFAASLSDALGYDFLLTTVEGQAFVDSLKTYVRIHPPRPARYVLYRRRR